MIRHTKATRCPVCEGADGDKRGADKRCFGFSSDDGKWVHCTRSEFAGSIQANPRSNTYAHLIGGACKCGAEHAPAPTNGAGPDKIVSAYYEYHDEKEKPLYRVTRYFPKTFRQERWDAGANAWVGGEGCMKGVRRVLYRLPEVLASTGPVLILEGEKDVDNAWALGYPATCNVGGAKKWSNDYSESLKGRRCIIIPDQDPDGEEHARQVHESLSSLGIRSRKVSIPAKDLSAWISSGATKEDIEKALNTKPDWKKTFDSVPVNATELAEYIDLPIPYIVKPIIVRGSLTQIQGAPKGGKSAFSVYLSLCATTGIWPHPEHFNSPVPLKVLYIAWEDPKIMMAKRLSLYSVGLGLGRKMMPTNLNFLFGPDIFIEEDQSFEALKAACDELKPDIVVVDTLSHIHQAEENSSSEMKIPMKNLDRFAKESDIGVVYIHHTAKSSGDRISQDKGRGSSVIAAAWHVLVDWGIREKGSNTNPVCIQSKFEHGDILLDVVYEKQQNEFGEVTGVKWIPSTSEPKKVKKSSDEEKKDLIIETARRVTLLTGSPWFSAQALEMAMNSRYDYKTIKRHLADLIEADKIEMRIGDGSGPKKGGTLPNFYRLKDGNLV